jgi:hypothetical protein
MGNFATGIESIVSITMKPFRAAAVMRRSSALPQCGTPARQDAGKIPAKVRASNDSRAGRIFVLVFSNQANDY